MKLHHVRLPRKDQAIIRKLLGSGIHPARVIRRANILLKADAGLKDAVIALHLDCTRVHVANIRQRYCMGGLQRALYDLPRSGKPPAFSGKDAAAIVALACTDAPEGHARWTLKLLARQARERGIVNKISPQAVWLMLERQDCKPWLEKNVVHTLSHGRVQGTDGRYSESVREGLRSRRAGRLSG